MIVLSTTVSHLFSRRFFNNQNEAWWSYHKTCTKVTLHLAKFTSQSVICFRNIAYILSIDIQCKWRSNFHEWLQFNVFNGEIYRWKLVARCVKNIWTPAFRCFIEHNNPVLHLNDWQQSAPPARYFSRGSPYTGGYFTGIPGTYSEAPAGYPQGFGITCGRYCTCFVLYKQVLQVCVSRWVSEWVSEWVNNKVSDS